MAGEPALTKVMLALTAMLGGIAGHSVITDRNDDEPLTAEERPAFWPRIVEDEFSTDIGQGDTVHRVLIEIDLFEKATSADTISNALGTMLSAVIAAIHADRTLGGLLQELEEISFTAAAESVADLGCGTLSLTAVFVTPRGDFNTVMGVSGPIP